jgi:TldD protein
MKSSSYDSGEGFGLRVVTGETTGYAHASEVSEAAIARAAASAGRSSAATPGR